MLRRTRKPVFLAVNKCDNLERRHLASAEFARFGANTVHGISALHGNGTNDLLDTVVASLPVEKSGEPSEDEGIRVAVVGRPNVGKSTLVNKILGFERTIANPMPGTTRDSIDTTFERGGQRYTLVDTAGIRRRGKVEKGAEKLSVLSAVLSLQRCDIAIVLVDAVDGLTEQDAHVAGYAVDSGCGVILGVNKWDAIEKDEKTAGAVARLLHEELGFLKHAPVIQISALTGQRVDRLFELIGRVHGEYCRDLETRELNEFLKRATTHLSPPVQSGKQLKIKYVTQTGTRPPTFTFFVNDPKLVHFSYERYLANQLRREYGFEGVPVRLRFKRKAEDLPPGRRAGRGRRGE
jgi:GTP-binding protein